MMVENPGEMRGFRKYEERERGWSKIPPKDLCFRRIIWEERTTWDEGWTKKRWKIDLWKVYNSEKRRKISRMGFSV